LNLIQVMLAEEKRVKEYTQKKGFYKASELEFKASKQSSRTKNIAVAAVLTGLTVALSSFYIPLGTTKCFPAQHMINGIAGVLLGPWYAMFMALATGTIRNLLGLGTVYAFPGGIPGALVVGLIHRYVAESDMAAIAEPLGTVGIGATLSALLFAPMLGQSLTLYFFWAAFAASSVPGAILGYIVLKGLRRLGVDKLLV
jgi:energy coupling factor transporter S component ThiW